MALLWIHYDRGVHGLITDVAGRMVSFARCSVHVPSSARLYSESPPQSLCLCHQYALKLCSDCSFLRGDGSVL